MVVDDIEMIVPAKGKKRTYNYWFPPTQQYLSSGELRRNILECLCKIGLTLMCLKLST